MLGRETQKLDFRGGVRFRGEIAFMLGREITFIIYYYFITFLLYVFGHFGRCVPANAVELPPIVTPVSIPTLRARSIPAIPRVGGITISKQNVYWNLNRFQNI